jgi:hypothetical protein
MSVDGYQLVLISFNFQRVFGYLVDNVYEVLKK